ncbi:MAG: DUF349 domain-containing protein [Pseudomonadota bacterium]
MVFRWLKSRDKRSAPAARPDPVAPPPTAEAQARAAFAQLSITQALAEVRGRADRADRIDGYLQRRDLEDALWEDGALAEPGALAEIERASRNRNKRINREARARLKALRSAATQRAALLERAQELTESATRINSQQALATRDLTARTLIDEQWATLVERWQALPPPPGDTATLPELPPLNTELPLLETPPPTSDLAEDRPAAAEPADASPAGVVEALDNDGDTAPVAPASSDAAASEDAAKSAAMERLQAAESRRLALLESEPPLATEPLDRVDALRNTVRALSTLLRDIDWPESAAVPQELAEITARVQTTETALTETEATVRALGEQVEIQIGELRALLDDGQTRKAGTLHGQIRRAQPERLGLPRATLSRLNAASGELRALGNWAQYAASPKREALLEAISSAASEPLDPPLQAEKIKELRREWQALGPPRGEQERAAQARFDEAAERAFEPCKAHFEALATQRQANASAREDICESLQAYLDNTDWRSADFAAAEAILREARNSWRTHHPVPRKQEKPLAERFEALQARLHERLKGYWDANAAAKQMLIDRVTALRADETTALRDRLDQAKAIQRDWQRIGKVPRKQDQALWQAFRSGCDALFAQRDAAAAAARDAVTAQVESVRAMLREFEDVVAAFDVDNEANTALDAGLLRTFENRFAGALKPLPPGPRKALQQDARLPIERYRARLAKQAQAALTTALADRARWDETFATTPDAVPDAAPPGLFPTQPMAGDLQGLHDLAIEAELWADQPSPASDQARRLELKVAALSSSLGGGGGGGTAGPSALTLADRWCALGAKPDTAEVQALRARFFAALNAGADRGQAAGES